MKQLYLLAAVIGWMWCGSCNVINPAETVPTYVHIDSFSFSGNALMGSSSHKITNVYVYFNNQAVGIFDLPVTFPVNMTGSGVLQVLPGIDFDGLTAYEVPYPFYLADTLRLNPAPGQIIPWTPKTRYTITTPNKLIDFEDGLPAFAKVQGDTSFVAINDPARVFEGQYCGYLKLVAPLDSAVHQSTAFTMPYDQESYIELNYRSTMPFQVGLRTVGGSGANADYTEYLIGLNPRATWGKVYIGTRSFAGAHQGNNFYIMLRTLLPVGQSEGEVFLDNVKVVAY